MFSENTRFARLGLRLRIRNERGSEGAEWLKQTGASTRLARYLVLTAGGSRESRHLQAI